MSQGHINTQATLLSHKQTTLLNKTTTPLTIKQKAIQHNK